MLKRTFAAAAEEEEAATSSDTKDASLLRHVKVVVVVVVVVVQTAGAENVQNGRFATIYHQLYTGPFCVKCDGRCVDYDVGGASATAQRLDNYGEVSSARETASSAF